MIRLAALLIWLACAAQAQVAVTEAAAQENRDGVTLTMGLTAITPYRVFTLDDPRRLIVDLAAVDAGDLRPDGFGGVPAITAVRASPLRPGWARLILDLATPLNIRTAGMARAGETVDLSIALEAVSADDFATAAGAPPDPGWEAATGFDPQVAARQAEGRDFVVLLDPAHGGDDTGVLAGDLREADLTLIMAEELALRLNRINGIRAVLARQGDADVPDAARLRMAEELQPDLVLRFHADAGEVGGLRVATFGEGALALEGHSAAVNEGAVTGAAIGSVLDDLARAQTLPEAERIADALAAGFARSGVPVPRTVRIKADIPLLRAARYPVVVVLLGGMADTRTRDFLVSPEGRNTVAAAIAETLILLAR